jgi:uncharacterized protein (TIGR02118 family)|tara:strand:+ start:618 stop:1247 length:630 start_codon:yes stop_codon:yes gene_type:complete
MPCQDIGMHELIAVGNDVDAALEIAKKLNGISYINSQSDATKLPFRTLVRVMTDDPSQLSGINDVGSYLAFSRCIRERPQSSETGATSPGITAIFPLLRHPNFTHKQADSHWRDIHAPLALKHHPGMWDYTQLSIVQTFSGTPIDGFALVSFESLIDMKERFFGDDNDREVIYKDVATFADSESPRRVITTETINGLRPPVPKISWAQG